MLLESNKPDQSVLDAERDRYFSLSFEKLETLSDWAINLYGLLLFKSGYESPTKPVRAAQISLQKQIGSPRGGAAASKKLIRTAAKELTDAGLLSRTRAENRNGLVDGPGCPFLWQLEIPESSFAFEGDWDLMERYVALVFRTTENGTNPNSRAAAIRLSADADSNGIWTGSSTDLKNSLAVSTTTTAKARIQTALLEKCGIESAHFGIGEIRIELTKPTLIESPEDLEAEVDALVNQLWKLDLVKELAVKIAHSRRQKELGYRDQRDYILQPMIDLQKDFAIPALIEYGLEETLKSNAAEIGRLDNWSRYCRKVLENNRSKFIGQ